MDSSSTTEVSIRRGGNVANPASTVCVRGGKSDSSSQIQVQIAKSTVRTQRRNRDRRGTRWMRGRLMLDFGHLEEVHEDDSISGEIKLSDQEPVAFGRRRGRARRDDLHRFDRPLRGIPFSYYYRLNRLFSRLNNVKHRPYEDVKVNALRVKDDGNQIPLSVIGISTVLVDSGCSQKDFMVSAKVIVMGDQMVVEPTLEVERSVDLGRISPGQGVLMMEYLALSNRIAHVFVKGQIDSTQFRKALALGVQSCQSIAESAAEVLRRKYDNSSELNPAVKRSAFPVIQPSPPTRSDEVASLKSSFQSMLSSTGSKSSTEKRNTTTGSVESQPHSTMDQVNISGSKAPLTQAPANNAGKKLSLADLAKAKKKS